MAAMVTAGPPRAPDAHILALARQVAAIVKRVAGDSICHVFLFGSQVTGRAGPRADLDIGIEAPTALDARTMQAIREECERLPTLRTIDLLDFASVDPEFRRAASVWAIEADPT
jgi:predicted nucleotidyltransferase